MRRGVTLGGFTGEFGHIQYRDVMGRAAPQHWREAYKSTASCEMPGCVTLGRPALVFDHCHRHGWVRGILCNGCNVRVGYLEAVMVVSGITVDLGATPYAAFLARCPGCVDGQAYGPHVLPARGRFAPAPARKTGWQPVAPCGPPVARPRARLAHHPLDDRRTLCGLQADAMTPASSLPICGSCARTEARGVRLVKPGRQAA